MNGVPKRPRTLSAFSRAAAIAADISRLTDAVLTPYLSATVSRAFLADRFAFALLLAIYPATL
jgi:hypothetical protein